MSHQQAGSPPVRRCAGKQCETEGKHLALGSSQQEDEWQCENTSVIFSLICTYSSDELLFSFSCSTERYEKAERSSGFLVTVNMFLVPVCSGQKFSRKRRWKAIGGRVRSELFLTASISDLSPSFNTLSSWCLAAQGYRKQKGQGAGRG